MGEEMNSNMGKCDACGGEIAMDKMEEHKKMHESGKHDESSEHKEM